MLLHDLLFRLRSSMRRYLPQRTNWMTNCAFTSSDRSTIYVKSGISQAEAMRRARLQFGGLDQVKNECREARGVSFVETLVQDLHVQRWHPASLARIYCMRCADAGTRDRR